MRWRFGRFVVLCIVVACSYTCGSPSGPSAAGGVAGTATFDGQTLQFTEARNASKGSRRPTNPAWPRGLFDLTLGNCSRPPGVIMAIYDSNPSPGRYEVPAFDLTSPVAEVVTASLQSPTEPSWNAGANHRGSSGSLTVASISSTRISGSFSFTLVQRVQLPPEGIRGPLPPAPTKQIEGTFDLSINNDVICP